MTEFSTTALIVLLGILIAMSAFFSGSETALMTLNRYRLRHLAKTGHRGARLAEFLLKRPDRLIGVILLGNNLVNISAASIATIIGLKLYGEIGIAIATGALTIIILIFAEVLPKTLAALHPESLAFPAAYLYRVLLVPLYPVVFLINLITNSLLRIFGVSPEEAANHSLSSEELRTVVAEAGAMIPRRHQRMLLSLLDLERETVEDIMVPRNEIMGIDLDDDWEKIMQVLVTNQHTRLPLYRGGIDDLVGIVHLRRVLSVFTEGNLNQNTLLELAREPYYIPEGTPLNQQLVNFQKLKRRIGFVVDEYGDILGLVTLEDILEEIIGEFTTDPSMRTRHVHMDGDNHYLADGSATIRHLNKAMGWRLPSRGPKTLNGLIVEHFEDIPKVGTLINLDGYVLEIAELQANVVKTVRIQPPAKAGKKKKKSKPPAS